MSKSREALMMLGYYGFERGRDLNRILHTRVKSLDRGELRRFVDTELKPRRLYWVYGDEMSMEQISRELLLSHRSVKVLLLSGRLKSCATVDVYDLLEDMDRFCKKRSIFWQLYRISTYRVMMEICGCSHVKVKRLVKSFGLVKKGIISPHIEDQPHAKGLILLDLNSHKITNRYPSLLSAERDGYNRKTVRKSAGTPDSLTRWDRVHARKWIYEEQFDESRFCNKKRNMNKCDIPHLKG